MQEEGARPNLTAHKPETLFRVSGFRVLGFRD